MDINDITSRVIGAAIKVHTFLGPGLLESTYQTCMEIELAKSKIEFRRQVPIDIVYNGTIIESAYKVDLIVELRY